MSKKRIVVKVGSNVLTREDGKLDITRMSALVDQVAWLHALDYEVILVSSGAMASGRGEISVARRLDSVAQRQLYSALGQAKLINHYYNLFREYRLPVGQVLTMKENFNSRRAYLNQRACMEVMLDNGVIPIVNENDTVSVTELMFTDNDELSGLIAQMMQADTLILLSNNIDGIYDGPPDDPASHLIGHVEPGSDLSAYIQSGRSGFGRGGMVTKYNIAKKVAEEGIRVIIANGKRDNILVDLVEHPDATPHTEFEPTAEGVSGITMTISLASLLVGLICIVFPSMIMGLFAVVAIIYGIILIVSGVYKAKSYTDAKKTGAHLPAISLISAILSVALGIVIVINPFGTVMRSLFTFAGIALIVEAGLDLTSVILNTSDGKKKGDIVDPENKDITDDGIPDGVFRDHGSLAGEGRVCSGIDRFFSG